jgi:hypothetical protein
MGVCVHVAYFPHVCGAGKCGSVLFGGHCAICVHACVGEYWSVLFGIMAHARVMVRRLPSTSVNQTDMLHKLLFLVPLQRRRPPRYVHRDGVIRPYDPYSSKVQPDPELPLHSCYVSVTIQECTEVPHLPRAVLRIGLY